MANSCATIGTFLAFTGGEFNTAGSLSAGTLTVAVQPSPGDTVTLATRYGVPIVTEVYVADTDFDIGVDEAATATNLAAAISLGALAVATAAAGVISVTSTSTGPIGALSTTTSNATAFVWGGAVLVGGELLVQSQLTCACEMINLACWGDKADCGHMYLTAHMLATMGHGSGESGAVTGKSIDKLSISYAAGGTASANGGTKWGRMYDQIKSTLMAPGFGTGTWPVRSNGSFGGFVC